MSKENEEILTATSTSGDTSVMICRIDDSNGSQKVCMDVNETGKKVTSKNNLSSPKTMFDNNTYNLLEQLLVENKSLWRIKKHYKHDAGMDNETRQVWNFIEKDKEELARILTEKVKERL